MDKPKMAINYCWWIYKGMLFYHLCLYIIIYGHYQPLHLSAYFYCCDIFCVDPYFPLARLNARLLHPNGYVLINSYAQNVRTTFDHIQSHNIYHLNGVVCTYTSHGTAGNRWKTFSSFILIVFFVRIKISFQINCLTLFYNCS